jgi:hypothetical protein
MKIKSMIAALAASALAVCAVAPMSASAETAKLTDITGITFYISCPQAATENAEGGLTWYGGAFGVNSGSTDWTTDEWCVNEDTDKKVVAEKIDDTHYKVTWTKALFSADDTWAQAVYQAYGPEDTVLEKVVLEGVGMEITASSNPDAFAFPDASKGYKAGTVYLFGDSTDGQWHGVLNVPAETEAPATTAEDKKDDTASTTTKDNGKKTDSAKGSGTSTDAAKTGDAGVGVAIAALSLAGTAALVARRKH